MSGLEHVMRTGFHSSGSPWKAVLIEEVDIAHGIAMCIDAWGRHQPIPLRVRRAKGPLPRPGELWHVDQAVGGRWTFAQIITENLEEVEGYVARDLASPFALMANQGLIQDQMVAVDTYPWVMDIDVVPTPGDQAHWSLLPMTPWARASDATAGAYVEWPVVFGPGHWKIEVIGFVGTFSVAYVSLINLTLSIDGIAVGALGSAVSDFTGEERVSLPFDITTPGKHALRLTTSARVAIQNLRLIKTAQL